MGITGLLPFLDKASERINIKSLANKTVAIDSYCWLHKGAFAVGDKLVRGEETDVHIMYCIKYVNMLLSHNIKPILVFDGRHLPAKADTEAKRRESRKNAKQRAIELMRKGNHHEARKYLRRCVDITHEMALQLIQCCRDMNVDCVVAPYEADAELAYLNKIGLADYVITEDSDLTLFGCKKILFKLDLTGACVLVDADKLHLAMGCHPDKFTMEKFRFMCILSGCDYIDSLPGIGLAKACKFIMKTEETDMMRALDKIPAYLNMRQLTITEEYKINVLRANATFQHMVVFDPRQRKQVRLNEPEEIGTEIELCCNAGDLLDDDVALNLATGNLNPFTMKQLDNWHPDACKKQTNGSKPNNWKRLTVAKHPSIWTKEFRFTSSKLSNDKSQPSTKSKFIKSNSLPSIRPSIRSFIQLIESDTDKTVQETENADTLLSEYSNAREPPQKRFRDQSNPDNATGTNVNGFDDKSDIIAANGSPRQKTTPNRNPFKKQNDFGDNNFVSPTKITKENCSLIRNQSPVKIIDYKKLAKLSKFNRTAILENKQNVISRFFSSGTTCNSSITISSVSDTQNRTTPNNDESNNTDSDVNQMKMEKPEPEPESELEPTYCLYLNASSDSAISSNSADKSPKRGQTSEDLKSHNKNDSMQLYGAIVESSQSTVGYVSQSTADKTDSELNELPIVLSDDDDDDEDGEEEDFVGFVIEELSHRQPMTKTKNDKQAPKMTCRKPGLSRKKPKAEKKSSGKAETNSIQSRLSMFGFQKKSQAS